MTSLPPPTGHSERFAVAPVRISTNELLFRFQRMVAAMTIVAIALALLPVPAVVPAVALLVFPMFVLVAAISSHDRRDAGRAWRWAHRIWEFRRDPADPTGAPEPVREPVSGGIRRAWLLLGMFGAVFLIGLVLAAVSAGVSAGIYG